MVTQMPLTAARLLALIQMAIYENKDPNLPSEEYDLVDALIKLCDARIAEAQRDHSYD
jgi:hypothetical protein